MLQEAQDKMGLGEGGDRADDKPAGIFGRAAARCWALLLVRIYECLPLLCPRCGEPMRIIAFVLDPPVIERILRHMESFHDPAKAMWRANGTAGHPAGQVPAAG